ncbi:phage tail tube protein [Clostridium massiliodielmoense]|uniref:phage tail tube protein n=1 Tax=Clostridium massiliodielmoense TaxID=1776385 RepID=UPI001FA8D5B1|nr:phage tail tube protein [Clostridium massiliodielmoense]
MAANMRDKEVINGTFGECWIDNEIFGNTTKLQAKATLKKTPVPMCGTLRPGQKVTGVEYKGSVKMHKVNSRLTKKIAMGIKNGQTPEFTIISKLADPDNAGAERVALYGVTFDDVNLIDWEVAKLSEDTLNFTYLDFDYLDSID